MYLIKLYDTSLYSQPFFINLSISWESFTERISIDDQTHARADYAPCYVIMENLMKQQERGIITRDAISKKNIVVHR